VRTNRFVCVGVRSRTQRVRGGGAR
jgi:hypothetical protein